MHTVALERILLKSYVKCLNSKIEVVFFLSTMECLKEGVFVIGGQDKTRNLKLYLGA